MFYNSLSIKSENIQKLFLGNLGVKIVNNRVQPFTNAFIRIQIFIIRLRLKGCHTFVSLIKFYKQPFQTALKKATMNTLKNRVQLIGRLGQDPEVKTLETGKKVARFSIATSDNYVGKDGNKVTETQWHHLVVWGPLTTICEKYLKKGREIAVEGKLAYRNWNDKDGMAHNSTEIVVNELLLLNGNAR